MNKLSKTILISSIAIFGVGFLLIPSTSAQAQDLIDVEVWDGEDFVQCPDGICPPLFTKDNFLPGDSAEGLFQVTNISGEEQPIATEIIKYEDPDELGNYLNLEIKEGETSHYTGTLSGFYNEGEFYLSNLVAGINTQYKFIVTFDPATQDDDPEAPDTIQGKSLTFDILIGAQGKEGGPPPLPGVPGGGLPPGLTISEESVRATTTETSVTITWTTSYLSTSQVIYDTIPGQFNLSAGPSNYGYTYSKEGDDTGLEKVTSHSVTITGLTSGTTYYYRTVSHASLAISQEYSFTTLGAKVEEKVEEEIKEEIAPPEEEIPTEEVVLAPTGEEVEKPKEFVPEGAAPAEEEVVNVPPEERAPGEGLAPLLLASVGVIRESGWMAIVVIFCIIGLVIIGIREWELARKKKKNIS